LVGRAAELAYLRALVDDGRGVVLAGAAGVGKSRLLQELIASLDGSRWHVERATGTPAAAASALRRGRAAVRTVAAGTVRRCARSGRSSQEVRRRRV
jgi:alpha-D-ribose 1-methylphosphonate 5-triphosphate synthase subunit PhnL